MQATEALDKQLKEKIATLKTEMAEKKSFTEEEFKQYALRQKIASDVFKTIEEKFFKDASIGGISMGDLEKNAANEKPNTLGKTDLAKIDSDKDHKGNPTDTMLNRGDYNHSGNAGDSDVKADDFGRTKQTSEKTDHLGNPTETMLDRGDYQKTGTGQAKLSVWDRISARDLMEIKSSISKADEILREDKIEREAGDEKKLGDSDVREKIEEAKDKKKEDEQKDKEKREKKDVKEEAKEIKKDDKDDKKMASAEEIANILKEAVNKLGQFSKTAEESDKDFKGNPTDTMMNRGDYNHSGNAGDTDVKNADFGRTKQTSEKTSDFGGNPTETMMDRGDYQKSGKGVTKTSAKEKALAFIADVIGEKSASGDIIDFKEAKKMAQAKFANAIEAEDVIETEAKEETKGEKGSEMGKAKIQPPILSDDLKKHEPSTDAGPSEAKSAAQRRINRRNAMIEILAGEGCKCEKCQKEPCECEEKEEKTARKVKLSQMVEKLGAEDMAAPGIKKEVTMEGPAKPAAPTPMKLKKEPVGGPEDIKPAEAPAGEKVDIAKVLDVLKKNNVDPKVVSEIEGLKAPKAEAPVAKPEAPKPPAVPGAAAPMAPKPATPVAPAAMPELKMAAKDELDDLFDTGEVASEEALVQEGELEIETDKSTVPSTAAGQEIDVEEMQEKLAALEAENEELKEESKLREKANLAVTVATAKRDKGLLDSEDPEAIMKEARRLMKLSEETIRESARLVSKASRPSVQWPKKAMKTEPEAGALENPVVIRGSASDELDNLFEGPESK